jgi:hypothetical protein
LGHWIIPFEPPASQFLTIRETGGHYEVVVQLTGGTQVIKPLSVLSSSKGPRFAVQGDEVSTNYTILKDGNLDIRDEDGEFVVAQRYTGDASSVAAIDAAMDAVWKDASCRLDAVCLGDRYRVVALQLCTAVIERQAQYDYRWTDSWLAGKFVPGATWHGKDGRKLGQIDYIGEKIMFQNGFGAWLNYIYVCTYDTQKEDLVDVRLKPGHLSD